MEALGLVLAFDRWNIARDVIDAGMIADNALLEDWDGDGLSNMQELAVGTNPLNELETDPADLSRRFLLLVNGSNVGTNWVPTSVNVLYAYHIAKRNGYDDDEIALFLQTDDRESLEPEGVIDGVYAAYPERIIKQTTWTGRFGGMDLLLEPASVPVDYRDSQVTTTAVLDAMRSFPANNNDAVMLSLNGHGLADRFNLGPGNDIFASQLAGALRESATDRWILLLNHSFSGGHADALMPGGSGMILASRDADTSMKSAGWLVLVADTLDGGGSLSEVRVPEREFNPVYWWEGEKVAELPSHQGRTPSCS